ncbi:cytochrome P450 [Trypanosoma cruzi Dm28c]|uniref:Cytochrome P450 n=1 Tax=Trypanosoma cruzi Dm28c TaxID=1416333 RepID=V5AZ09_TRYCR|nr:cytochrome P450 [Trypanosoma cruzi Dm28c]
MEEDRSFCAFDVTTWPSRVWNEGASGVIIDLRCAYQCWQQDNEQVKLAFDNLVEWISALEGLQDPTDRIMNLGRSLLNTFRMQLTIASDPGIRLSKLRARLYTAVHQTDAYARAAQLFVDRRETQRTVRCQRAISLDTRHLHAMCAREGITHNTGALQKTAEGLLHAAHECGRRQPHPTRHLPPIRTGVAPRRRCSTLYFKLPDAIVGKGNGAYP